MNDAFRYCPLCGDADWPEGVECRRVKQAKANGDPMLYDSATGDPLPDASRPLATELDTDASGVVSYPGAEEIRGRADVPLAGTPQAPDENPGNKPPQTLGASEGI